MLGCSWNIEELMTTFGKGLEVELITEVETTVCEISGEVKAGAEVITFCASLSIRIGDGGNRTEPSAEVDRVTAEDKLLKLTRVCEVLDEVNADAVGVAI